MQKIKTMNLNDFSSKCIQVGIFWVCVCVKEHHISRAQKILLPLLSSVIYSSRLVGLQIKPGLDICEASCSYSCVQVLCQTNNRANRKCSHLSCICRYIHIHILGSGGILGDSQHLVSSAFKNYFKWCLGDCMKCRGLITRSVCKQTPYPLFYLSGPLLFAIKFKILKKRAFIFLTKK